MAILYYLVWINLRPNGILKIFSTALLGSCILIYCAVSVFGGFPEEVSDLKVDEIVLYMAGFLILFVTGSIVQFKLFKKKFDRMV